MSEKPSLEKCIESLNDSEYRFFKDIDQIRRKIRIIEAINFELKSFGAEIKKVSPTLYDKVEFTCEVANLRILEALMNTLREAEKTLSTKITQHATVGDTIRLEVTVNLPTE